MPTPVLNVLYTAQNGEWVSPGRPNLPGGPETPVDIYPRLRVNGVRAVGPAIVAPPVGSAEWSDSNLPWAYDGDESLFIADWPAGTTVVDIQTASGDFLTNLKNTVNAAGKRVVVRLGVGIYSLNKFVAPISTNQGYAFGVFIPNLQGILGRGPDKTFIQMEANSFTQEQIDIMETYTFAVDDDPLPYDPGPPVVRHDTRTVNQMAVMRLDGTNPSSPVLLAGFTIRAADQQMMTSKGSDVAVVLPQPANHHGISLYYNTYAQISYVRFTAAGKAMTSLPPFEQANLTSAQSWVEIRHCEFDGRRAAYFDQARPRRCSNVMGNNEKTHLIEDSWLHHTNVSRYAVNDQNINGSAGTYTVRRVKSDHITELQNTDPNLNNGQSLGGWTNASSFGWESTNGKIYFEDNYVELNNSNTSGQFATTLQLTSVASVNPQGGRLYLIGGKYTNIPFPWLNNYVTLRIAKGTYWYMDGMANTLDIRKTVGGPKLAVWEYTGAWPPSASAVAAAGISPNTHYIAKGV